MAIPKRSETDKVSLSLEIEQIVNQAKVQAKALGHNYVGTEHLVLAHLGASDSAAAEFLKMRGVTIERFQEEVVKLCRGQ